MLAIISKMILRKLIYLILILLSITSCEKNYMSDEKILSDIFPELVDSLHIKWRPIPPPPLSPIFDNDSNFIGVDSTKMELILEEHQKFLKRFDSIDSRIIIGISDTCFLIKWDDLKSKTYNNKKLISLISLHEQKINYSKELNLCQVNINKEFKLISKSKIEEKYSNMWSMIKEYKFAGLLEVSRILLSEDNDFGLLQIDYYYEELDGYSYFIIIEIKNDKWRVKELLRNWVT